MILAKYCNVRLTFESNINYNEPADIWVSVIEPKMRRWTAVGERLMSATMCARMETYGLDHGIAEVPARARPARLRTSEAVRFEAYSGPLNVVRGAAHREVCPRRGSRQYLLHLGRQHSREYRPAASYSSLRARDFLHFGRTSQSVGRGCRI